MVPSARVSSHDMLFGSNRSSQRESAASFTTVVIIGNCIAEGMEVGLSSSKIAESKYRFVAIPLHLRSLQEKSCQDLIGEASHVFIQELGGVDWPLIKATVAPGTQLFSFPSIALFNLWPFDSSNGPRDEVAQSFPAGGKIRHFDGALARLREIEPDKKKRIARYRDLDFDLAGRIEVIAETQRRFFEEIDKNSDAYIARFVLRHFQDQQLFYNTTHPSGIMFQELCEYCWRKLGLEGKPPAFTGIDSWKDWSVPVHPGIARRLGVLWAHESTRYNYCTLGEVTWEQWVEAYVDTFG
jgi:hypothetical protein